MIFHHRNNRHHPESQISQVIATEATPTLKWIRLRLDAPCQLLDGIFYAARDLREMALGPLKETPHNIIKFGVRKLQGRSGQSALIGSNR
jgi:hypothetical protein